MADRGGPCLRSNRPAASPIADSIGHGESTALVAERGLRALALPVVTVGEQLPAVLEASLAGLGHPYDLVQVFTARAHGLRWVSLDGQQLRRLRGTPLADAAQSLEQALAGLG